MEIFVISALGIYYVQNETGALQYIIGHPFITNIERILKISDLPIIVKLLFNWNPSNKYSFLFLQGRSRV